MGQDSHQPVDVVGFGRIHW